MISHKVFQQIDGRRTDLVITCASDAVRATLFYFETGAAPRALVHTHKNLEIKGDITEQSVFDASVIALEELCDDIAVKSAALFQLEDLLKDHQKIHHVSVFLASPWTLKTTYTDEKKFTRPTMVTDEHVNELLQDAIPQGYTRLDNYVASVHANGYTTSIESLVGKSVKNFDLSIVDVFARFDHVETVYQVIQTKLNIAEEQVGFMPYVSALLWSVNELYKPVGDYMIMYMHEAYTDLVLFRNGRVVAITPVLFGFGSMIKRILDIKLATSLTQAYSIVEMYSRGHLDEQTAGELNSIFEQSVISLETLLDIVGANTEDSLPRDWYLVHDNALAAGIAKGLQDNHAHYRIIDCAVAESGKVIDQDNSDTLVNSSHQIGLFLQSHDSNNIVR